MEQGGIVPFVNRTFEWGVVIATFLSVLSVVPRHCARLAYFFHPKHWGDPRSLLIRTHMPRGDCDSWDAG